LGDVFLQELVVVSGDGLPSPPAPFNKASNAFRDVAKRAVERASRPGVDLDVVIMAPGRGNIAALSEALREETGWENLKGHLGVKLYSGCFNISSTTTDDRCALMDLANFSGRPLEDYAHFIWSGQGRNPRFSCLHSLCADITELLMRHNPFLAASWLNFQEEFHSELIRPKHPKLWAAGVELTSEERSYFADAALRFQNGEVQDYCKSLLDHPSIFQKIAGYKQGTVRAMALGIHYGPLCDCLIFLTAWLRNHRPELLCEERSGAWHLDASRTSVVSSADELPPTGSGLIRRKTAPATIGPPITCHAVQPKLSDPDGSDVADVLSAVLRKALFEAITLC